MSDEKTVVKKDPGKWRVIDSAFDREDPTMLLGDTAEEGHVLTLNWGAGDTHYEDGSRGMSLRCPMLVATGFMANQKETLERIAEVLNKHMAD